MLLSTAQDLGTGGNMGPVSDGGAAQDTIDSDVDVMPHSGLWMNEEGTKLDSAIQRALF